MGKTEAAKIIQDSIEESVSAKAGLLESTAIIVRIASLFIETIKKNGTIFLFGNGGSAADAQHIAAELVGRFAEDRQSLPAIALTVNTSNLTAIGNDYGYQYIFSRQLQGLMKKEDVAVAISTSGNSPNVLEGIKAARQKGCTTIGLTGESGGKLKNNVDLCLCVPATKPSRIQEMHILVGHVVCEIVERAFSNAPSALNRS